MYVQYIHVAILGCFNAHLSKEFTGNSKKKHPIEVKQ